MAKRKTSASRLYHVDLYQMCCRVWPLFGLDRLVKLSHRKRNGVLYCDNVTCATESITFSNTNARTSLWTVTRSACADGAVYSEPRLNVPNEASAADMQRFHDYGTRIVVSFRPKKSRTFAVEYSMYKPFDAGHRYVRGRMQPDTRIAKWEMTLDVSAYLRSGYSYSANGDLPRCEVQSAEIKDAKGRSIRGKARDLTAVETGEGIWKWRADNLEGEIFRLAWELEAPGESLASKTLNLEKLATELSIDPRFAKDLHNFVAICHYYVAGFRSLNRIGPEMMAHESVLRRSIESIEKTIEAELVRRTRGKGLIEITPAGEAVLDWWSQFYMRWTPISPDSAAAE